MIAEINIADIKIPRGREPRGDIAVLRQSIGEIGLLNPITVRAAEIFEPGGVKQGFRLIAGRNRLEVYRLEGEETIPANVVDLEWVDERLAEIDENICRQQLTALEEAEQLKERKQIYEGKYPETKAAVAGGKARQGVASAESAFAEDVSEKTGKSRRSVEVSVRRAERIESDVRDAIRDTEIADSGVELDALAGASADNQRKIVKLIQAGEASTVREAKVALKPKKKTTKDDRIATEAKAIKAVYDKKSPEGQRAFLNLIGATIGRPKLKAVK